MGVLKHQQVRAERAISYALLIVTVLIESRDESSKVHMASCHHTATGCPMGIKLILDYIMLLELYSVSAILEFFLGGVYDFLSLFPL